MNVPLILSMLNLTDLKTGVAIDLDGAPCVVISYQHSKMARGGAIMRTKLKNLKTGSLFDMTFKGDERIEEAVVERHTSSFLYQEGDKYVFMDSQSFEQYELGKDIVGDASRFLKEGAELTILIYNENPVLLELPIKMELEVTHTEPGVRGDTAQGGSKPATLETGAVITVPLFVKIGDILRINTVEGTYVERVR